jgi:hypothetical protein
MKILILLGPLFVVIATILYSKEFVFSDECLDAGNTWHQYSAQCITDFDVLIKKEIEEGNVHIESIGRHEKVMLTEKIIAPDGVVFMQGQYLIDLGDNETATGLATVGTNNTLIGDMSGNVKYYKYLIPFSVSDGGSGIFWYLGLFEADFKDHKITLLDSLLLGDRVNAITTHVGSDGQWVSFKDYAEGQSFADKPNKSIKINLTFNKPLTRFTVPVVEAFMGDTHVRSQYEIN